jgi:Trk K+ transport system NAD-binding subunit
LARVLIVGCGCRGLELAGELMAGGHIVRGTSRSEQRVAQIQEAGVEGVLADPDRLATLTPQLDAVSVMCWLMGSADGASEKVAALHGPRLETIVWKLVDTHVRGIVYEAAGTVDRGLLSQGSTIVRNARATFNMPAEVVGEDPQEHAAWLAGMVAGVERVLSA